MKRLSRSSKNRVFAGVIGGFGEYFDVDPLVFRLIYLFFLLATGVFPGVIFYLFAMIMMPLDTEPRIHTVSEEPKRS